MILLIRCSIAWYLLGIWVRAAILATTVDDASVSFEYLPATGAWTRDGFCAEGVCWATPNPSLLFGGTWHETTRMSDSPPFNITLKFDGVGIMVIGVLWDAPTIARLDLQFSVDNGSKSGSFVREASPISKDAFTYNQTVFSTDGLFDGGHTLFIAMNPNSWFMLDRVVVMKTVPDTTTTSSVSSGGSVVQTETSKQTGSSGVGQGPTTSSPSSSNTAAIIGGAVGGGLGGVLIGVVIAILFLRRRRAQEPPQQWPNEPNAQPSPVFVEYQQQPHIQPFDPWQMTQQGGGNLTTSVAPEFIPAPSAYSSKSTQIARPNTASGRSETSTPHIQPPPMYEEHSR